LNKKLLPIIAITLLIASFISCSHSENELKGSKYNKEEISKIVDEHLDISISTFQDSMDAKKGILGYKNIRDYIGLGEEDFQDRVLRTWNQVYDNQALKKKIELNLKSEKPIDIQLNKANEHISQYIHKISLSFAILIAEGFFDFLLDIFFGFTFAAAVVFIFVLYQFSYGGWKRMSKPRNDRINSIGLKAGRWATYTALFVSIILGVYSGDYSNDALKEKIKNDIKNDITLQIEKKLN
jgi:hypothetical protein